MKNLLLVTYVDFWRRGSGHRARISSIITYLNDKIEITVFFAGCQKDGDDILIRKQFPQIKFEFAGHDLPITFKEYREKFEDFIKDRYFEIALIEYIELSGVLEFLPNTTMKILDTHDVVFQRIKSFKKYGIQYDGIVLNKKEELNIYKCYDYVVLIQKNDFENIAKNIDSKKLLLVPHSTNCRKEKIKKKARNVGYVASPYSPNVDALSWFIRNVWTDIIVKHDLILNVYGNIKDSFLMPSETSRMNIVFHGFVDDLEEQYKLLDIIINPIRCGAGLKIKNVEALSHGIPLITSKHGASGIEDGASDAFLIADKPKEYQKAFDAILENYSLRKRLSNNAYKYAQFHFSQEKCYSKILTVIN